MPFVRSREEERWEHVWFPIFTAAGTKTERRKNGGLHNRRRTMEGRLLRLLECRLRGQHSPPVFRLSVLERV